MLVQEILLSADYSFPCAIDLALNMLHYPLYMYPLIIKSNQLILLFHPHLRSTKNIWVFHKKIILKVGCLILTLVAVIYVILYFSFRRYYLAYDDRRCFPFQEWVRKIQNNTPHSINEYHGRWYHTHLSQYLLSILMWCHGMCSFFSFSLSIYPCWESICL